MRSVAVFCGSAMGVREEYAAAAGRLGAELARRGMGLVYGGGNIGLMGVVANAVLEGGGKVVGVIPDFMMKKEFAHPQIDLRIVGSMHERKALMEQLAEGFVALPGGFGTLEEFCEILTWGQLGLHRKPFGLLNTCGFYGQFLGFLDHAVGEGLLKAKHRARVLEAGEPAELLEKMSRWVGPGGEGSIKRAEQT